MPPKSKSKPAPSKAPRSKLPAPSSPRLTLAAVCNSRTARFTVDPRQIVRDPDLNKRVNYGTPDEWKAFKANLRENGVRQEATIRIVDGKMVLVQGYRRHLGTLENIKEFPKDDALLLFPVHQEPPGLTQIQRLSGQITLNSGLPYTFLEKAQVFKAILDQSVADGAPLSHKAIARECHCSGQAVDDAMLLLTASKATIKLVEKDKVGASTVVELLKQYSPEEVTELVAKSLADAESQGKTRITPKHIKASTTPTTTGSSDGSSGGSEASDDVVVQALLRHPFGSVAYSEAADVARVDQLQAALDGCEVALRSKTKREDLASRIAAKGAVPEVPAAAPIPTPSAGTDYTQVNGGGGGGGGGGKDQRVSYDTNTNLKKLNEILEETERGECSDPHQYDIIEAVVNFLEGKHTKADFKAMLTKGF